MYKETYNKLRTNSDGLILDHEGFLTINTGNL